jgi:hypothetical protein
MEFSGRGKPDLPAGIPDSGSNRDSAVSEIIGSLMLISVVVVAVSIIGVALWSQPPPQKIPSLSAVITNQNCRIFVKHDGGDNLDRQTFQIFVDGVNQTANFVKRDAPGSWTTWVTGDTLVFDPPSCGKMPGRVDIIYNDGTVSSVIISGFLEPVCFADNFNDNSLGSAWATLGGTWTESDGILSQTSTASADPMKAIISNSGLDFGSNLTITAKVRVNSWIDGDMARAGVSLFTNTADGNGYNLLFHNDHNTVQFLDDKVIWLTPSYTFTFTNNNWYWFKLKMENGVLYGKIWADGGNEPATWPYSWARSGRTGYPALNGGSSDGAVYATVSFDDVTVCSN